MSKLIKSEIAQSPANRKESRYSGVLFLRDVPKTTKVLYKSACSERNRSMRDVTISLMRKFSAAVRNGKSTINITDIQKGATIDYNE